MMTYDEAMIKWAEARLKEERLDWVEVYSVGTTLDDQVGTVEAYVEYDEGWGDGIGGEWTSEPIQLLTWIRQLAEIGYK